MERSAISDDLTRISLRSIWGYQAATSLALVTHRNRTALILLGIPKLVRFDKIHHQPLMMVFIYLRNRGKSRGNSLAKPCPGMEPQRHPGYQAATSFAPVARGPYKPLEIRGVSGVFRFAKILRQRLRYYRTSGVCL